MLTILIILLVLAVVLPAMGVPIDTRLVAAVLVIALIVWLVGGSGLVVRG